MEYLNETKKAMTWLGKQKDTFFLGQTVEYPGSAMYRSLEDVDIKKRLEMPVAEDMQMGMSIGLALEGYIPITIFPRMDFLICAVNQLVNHLDKIKKMSNDEFNPGLIIRTQVGNSEPLYPGPQHVGDYYDMLLWGLDNVNVVEIEDEKNVILYYKTAYYLAKKGISTIMIEQPQGGKNPNKK